MSSAFVKWLERRFLEWAKELTAGKITLFQAFIQGYSVGYNHRSREVQEALASMEETKNAANQ